MINYVIPYHESSLLLKASSSYTILSVNEFHEQFHTTTS